MSESGDRPFWLPSREALAGYLVALIPPTLTTIDEQLDLLEAEIARAAEAARKPAIERALLDGQLEAIEWALTRATSAREALMTRAVAIATAQIFHNPLPPHATDEAERAADAATPTEEP